MGLFGNKNKVDELVILSPVDGKVKDLKKVNDEVFAGEMVGKGVAVTPTSNEVKSPVDGNIAVAFPTGHAYGIKTKFGVEMLVHIGVDTVSLNGEGFDMKVSQGKNVKTNSTLAEIDLDIIKKKAKSSDIIVVVTNESLGDYKITEVAKGEIKAGEPLYKLVK